MSGLEIFTLAVVCAWLGIISLAMLLVIRQVGLLTAKLELAGIDYDVSSDGVPIGAAVSGEVYECLPSIAEHTVLLFLSSTCTPCRDLVEQLQHQHANLSKDLIAVVAGREQFADDLIDALPAQLTTIRDPNASKVANSLQLRSAPFAMAIESGAVTAKAFIHDIADLHSLLGIDIDPLDDELIHPGEARRMEAVDHVS